MSYVEPKREKPWGPILAATPIPEPEPDMSLPNDVQATNAFQRIALAYVDTLGRAQGIFGVPPDGLEWAITDPSRADVRIDTKSLAVWGVARYTSYFANSTAGDPHEDAISKVLRDLANSDEAKQHRPQ